jgi:hypothetical protein
VKRAKADLDLIRQRRKLWPSDVAGGYSPALASVHGTGATPVAGFPADRGAVRCGVSFVNVAKQPGRVHEAIFGGEDKHRYLLETTGCGVAFFDYDNDGWLDIFMVNGLRNGDLDDAMGKFRDALKTRA